MTQQDALYDALKQVISYMPAIYNQQKTSSINTGEITIKYPYSEIPNNALLFVLPLFSSTDTPNKLIIKHARVLQDGVTIRYDNVKTYNILVEDINGKKRNAKRGDIVANRLCMFRFISGDSTNVILCNNPVYNNISCSTLSVTNSVTFYEPPKIITYEGSVEKESYLVTNKELQAVKDRLTMLENKFKVGTQTAEEYFDEHDNLPEGTIYMQVED